MAFVVRNAIPLKRKVEEYAKRSKKRSTYRSINAGEDGVELASVKAVGVGVHTVPVVHKLTAVGSIHGNLQRNLSLEVRDLEGGMKGVLRIVRANQIRHSNSNV